MTKNPKILTLYILWYFFMYYHVASINYKLKSPFHFNRTWDKFTKIPCARSQASKLFSDSCLIDHFMTQYKRVWKRQVGRKRHKTADSSRTTP